MLVIYIILFFGLLLMSVPIFISLGIPSVLWFFETESPGIMEE